MNLSKHMRAHLFGDRRSGQFAQNLLTLAGGRVTSVSNDGNVNTSPISTVVKSVEELVTKVFPNLQQNYQNYSWLCERVILAQKIVIVNNINNGLLEEIPGNSHSYNSIYSVVEESEVVNYPI